MQNAAVKAVKKAAEESKGGHYENEKSTAGKRQSGKRKERFEREEVRENGKDVGKEEVKKII